MPTDDDPTTSTPDEGGPAGDKSGDDVVGMGTDGIKSLITVLHAKVMDPNDTPIKTTVDPPKK